MSLLLYWQKCRIKEGVSSAKCGSDGTISSKLQILNVPFYARYLSFGVNISGQCCQYDAVPLVPYFTNFIKFSSKRHINLRNFY